MWTILTHLAIAIAVWCSHVYTTAHPYKSHIAMYTYIAIDTDNILTLPEQFCLLYLEK